MTFDLQKLTAAERLLWSHGVTAPDHIDLHAIANAHGAEVRIRPLGGCEARLVTFGERAVISISSASVEGRQRFSLAHELAHWICDRKTGSFLCAKEDIGPQNAEARSIEASANGYASQLILPNYLVDPWMQGKLATLDLASALAKDFSTSLTAAAIKMAKRTPTLACLACHSQTTLAWHQRSPKFPVEFYVVGELHQDTDAFRLAFGGSSGMTRPKREPANRWISGPNTYRLEVISQSIKLPDMTVLSLISLAS